MSGAGDASDAQNEQDELLRLRTGIDHIDDEVLRLINERARIAQRIGEIKQGAIYRPEREAQVLRRMAETNPGPLPDEAVQRIAREIMSACLSLEQPLLVAFLGPAGTFTETAARKHFGAAPVLDPCASIDDAFRAVEAGNVNYAVVPVENSTEGAVGRTLDLLLSSSVSICGEVTLRVHQNLLCKAAALDATKPPRCIYSHAQSLAQCHEWLDRNLPQVPRIPVASNAEAARLAAEQPDTCAIAGETAAQRYELNILARNIEDDPNNTTRFLILGAHDAGPSGQDKTSLICSAQNRAGAMHHLLAPLAEYGISMTHLESRPARGLGGGQWAYVFYIDVEGHQQQPQLAAALQALGERAGFLKILGSYPAAAM
jgi:chorismate mutase/prephenate dehydratase